VEVAVRLHAQTTLSPGKNKRLAGTQIPFGRCREEGNILALSGIEPNFFGCQIQQRSLYTDDASLASGHVSDILIKTHMCGFCFFNGVLSYLLCRIIWLVCSDKLVRR